MSIYFVSPNLNQGGNERDIVVLANMLREFGCNVHVYLFRKEGVLLKRLLSDVSVSEIGPFRMRYAIWRFIADMIILRERVVVIMCFDTACVVGVLKLIGIVKCSVVYRESSQPAKYAGVIFSKLYSLLFNEFDLVVAQTYVARGQLMNLGVCGEKIKVMHNPLALKRKYPNITGAGDVNLMCVGRVEQVKGFDRMIDAVVWMRTLGLNVKLKIVGAGSLRDGLIAHICALNAEDYISMPGHGENPFEFINGDEIFVLSSYYEGQPNVLMEAIASGLRCVVSSAGGGAREMMKNVGLERFVIDESEDFKSSLHNKVILALGLTTSDVNAAQNLFFEYYDADHVRNFYLTELRQLL